jgi:hypothetical protein
MMGLTFAWGPRYLAGHPAVAFINTRASCAFDAAIAVYCAISISPVPGLLVRAARDAAD